MKKYLFFAMAVILSVSVAMCIGAGAAEKITVNGEDWYIISGDLLAESGLGDPTTMYNEGIDLLSEESMNWLGHEDWNHTLGWVGWTMGSAYNEGVWGDTVRSYEKVTLSDGSEGYTIRLAGDGEHNVPGEFAIENLQTICEMNPGSSYVVVATVKANQNSNGFAEPCIVWNISGYNTWEELTPEQQKWFAFFDADNEWHTVTSAVYTVTGEEKGFTGEADSPAGVCIQINRRNMMGPTDETFIESVKVYEVSKTEPTPTPEPTATPEATATPEPTAEPEITPLPTKAPTSVPENTDNNESAKKGCGGVIGTTAAAAVITLLGTAVVLKKKH